MPFRDPSYLGSFNPAELALLQEAYNLCCDVLGRHPTSHDDKDRLARLVIRVFEANGHDPQTIAAKVAEIERQSG